MLPFFILLTVALLLNFQDLRHSCGSTILLANGVRMENIAKILGHKDIRMTQHYAQVSDKSILADMAAVEQKMAELEA